MTCSRPAAAWAGWPWTRHAASSSPWRSCAPPSAGPQARASRPASHRRPARPRGPAGPWSARDGLILGCEPNERSLRFGLERGYRALARLTSDRSRRIELVDMANAVRPKTWS